LWDGGLSSALFPALWASRSVGQPAPESAGLWARLILLPMTQARTRANGLVTPSPLDRWIDAMLRVLAELVHRLVSTLPMNRLRSRRDWHTPEADTVLPQGTNDTTQQETDTPAPQGSPAHDLPPSVSLTASAIHLSLHSRRRQAPFAGAGDRGMLPPPPSSGGGGLRARARKTEGASRLNLRPLSSALI
jgi:hypothetical protein